MVLDRGAKWLSLSMTGMDAQHIETRNLESRKCAGSSAG